MLYLRQEGRGIGLVEKLKAYNLQDEGLDTYEANERLGHQRDARRCDVAAEMLASKGWTAIRLLTNNPDKVYDLKKEGIEVREVVALKWRPTSTMRSTCLLPWRSSRTYARIKKGPSGALRKHLVKGVHATRKRIRDCGQQRLKRNELTRFI